jgi:hypothetical protein
MTLPYNLEIVSGPASIRTAPDVAQWSFQENLAQHNHLHIRKCI